MSKLPTRNAEQNEILGAFLNLLEGPTGDGGVKRAAGIKPNWKVDDSHEAAAYRHIGYWQNGEMVDKDSGCHPLAHAAWRLLAVAYQETQGARELEPADVAVDTTDEDDECCSCMPDDCCVHGIDAPCNQPAAPVCGGCLTCKPPVVHGTVSCEEDCLTCALERSLEPAPTPTPVDDIQAIADSLGGTVITVNVDDILLGRNLDGIPSSVITLAKLYIRQLVDAGRFLPVTLQVLHRS